MRKERIDTDLVLRWLKNELRLPILLQHGVIVLDRHRSEGIVIRRYPYAKNAEINGEGEDGAAHDENHGPEKQFPQTITQIRFLAFGHEAKL